MLPRSTNTRTQRESSAWQISGRSQEIQRLIGRSLRGIAELSELGERSLLVDCDVLQADGGTRTAAITGSYVAFISGDVYAGKYGVISSIPLKCGVAAISVGVVNNNILLDLCYDEDSKAQVISMLFYDQQGEFVEVQGTAEGKPYSKTTFDSVLSLAEKGIKQLFEIQQETIDKIRKL